MAVKTRAVSFPVVLGLHLMIITLCTLLVKVCAHQSILSSYFLIGIQSGSNFLVFVSNSFYLKLASLSCLLSGALNAKICFMVSVPAHLYPQW